MSAEGLGDLWQQQQLQERVLLLQVIFLVLYSGEPVEASLLYRLAAAVNKGLLGLPEGGLPPATAQLLSAAQRLGCLTIIAGFCVEAVLDDLSQDPAGGDDDPLRPGVQHPLDPTAPDLDSEFGCWWEGDSSASQSGGRAVVLMVWAAFLRLRQAQTSEAELAGLDWAVHARRAQQGGAFDELRSLLADSLLSGSEDGGAFRSVAKNALAAVLAAFDTVPSCQAPPRASVGALDCLALCLGREASLAEQFWDGGYRPDSPCRALLAGARRLFPAVPAPLLRLLGAACGPTDGSEVSDRNTLGASASQIFSAESAFRYLSALPSVAAVHSAADIGARGAPIQAAGEEGYSSQLRVVCVEALPLPGLPELVLPPGAQGVVRDAAWVSQWAELGLFSEVTAPPCLGKKEAVLIEWDVPADGFYLTLRLLAGESPRLGTGTSAKTTPHFLSAALGFVARALSVCPTLAPEMLAVRAHLPGHVGSGGAGLVDVGGSILALALASRSPPLDLAATALAVCRALAPHAPSEISAAVIGALGSLPEALEDTLMSGAVGSVGAGAARPPPGLERLRAAEASDARQRRSVTPFSGKGLEAGDCPWDAETELALCLASLLRRGAAEAVGPAGRQLMAALASHGLPPRMAAGLVGTGNSVLDVRSSTIQWGRASSCFEVLCAALAVEAGLGSHGGEPVGGRLPGRAPKEEQESAAEKAWKHAAACCSGQALQHMHRVLGRPGLASGPGGLGLPSSPAGLAGLPPSAAAAAEGSALALLRSVPLALARGRVHQPPPYGEVGGVSLAAVGICTGGWTDSTAAFAMAFLAEEGSERGEQLREAAAQALCALSSECLHPDTSSLLPAPLAAVALPPATYAADGGVSFSSVAANALDSGSGAPSKWMARLIASVAAAPPHARLAEVLLLPPGRGAARDGPFSRGESTAKNEKAAVKGACALQILWKQAQAAETDPNCLDSLKAALRGTARSPAMAELQKLTGSAGEDTAEKRKDTRPIVDCLLSSAVSNARTALRVQRDVRETGKEAVRALPRCAHAVKRSATCLMASAAALEAASTVPESIPGSLAALLTETADKDGLKDLAAAAGGAGVWVDGLPNVCTQALQCLALAALQQHILLQPEHRAGGNSGWGYDTDADSMHRGLGVHAGLGRALVRVAAPLLADLPGSTNTERAAILEASWSHLQKSHFSASVISGSGRGSSVGARIEAAGLQTVEKTRSLRLEGPLLQVALSGRLGVWEMDGDVLAAALGPRVLARSKERGLDIEACLAACGVISGLGEACRAAVRLARALKTVFWMGTAVPKAPRPGAAAHDALRGLGAEVLAALRAAAPLARGLSTGSVTLHALDRGLMLPGHMNFAAAVAREMLDLQVLLARVAMASEETRTGQSALPSRAALVEVCCTWLDGLLGSGGLAGVGPDAAKSSAGLKMVAQALDLALVAFGSSDELWGADDTVPIGLTLRSLGLALTAVSLGCGAASNAPVPGPEAALPVAAHALPCARAALAAALEDGAQVGEWLPLLERSLVPDGARLHGSMRKLLSVPMTVAGRQGGSLGRMLGALAAEKQPSAGVGAEARPGSGSAVALGADAPEALVQAFEALSLLLEIARADRSGAALRIGAALAREGELLSALVHSLKARVLGSGYATTAGISGGRLVRPRPGAGESQPAPHETGRDGESSGGAPGSKKMRLLDRPQADRMPGLKTYDLFWRAAEGDPVGAPPGSLGGPHRGPALLLELQPASCAPAVPALPWALPEGRLEGLAPACRAWFQLLELVAELLECSSAAPPAGAAPGSSSAVEHFLVSTLLQLRPELAIGGDPERVPSQLHLAEVTGIRLKARVLGAVGLALGKWQHSAPRAALADLNLTAASVLALAALPALRPRHLLQCEPGSRRELALAAQRTLPFNTVCGWFGLAALGSGLGPPRGPGSVGMRSRSGQSPASPIRHKKLFVRTPERARSLTPMPFSPRSPRSPSGASRQETLRVLKQASVFSFEMAIGVYDAALHALEFLGATVPSGEAEATELVCRECGLQPEGLRQVLHGLQEQCIGVSLDANAALATQRGEAESAPGGFAGVEAVSTGGDAFSAAGVSALMGRILAASARLLELLFGESQDQLAANSVQQATLNAVYTRFSSTTEEASRVGTLLGADMRAARMEAQSCHNRLLQMKNGCVVPQELESLRGRMLKTLQLMQGALDASSPAMGAPSPQVSGAGAAPPPSPAMFERGGAHGLRTQWQLALRGVQRLAAVLQQAEAEAETEADARAEAAVPPPTSGAAGGYAFVSTGATPA